jgi:ElaB/YqjD/DUF883 family membrane-anchored ribosome-binding protein
MDNDNLKNKTSALRDDAQDTAEDLASNLKDKARRFQESAREWQERATETTRQAAQSADTYVRDNPWNAVAYAGIACFVVGFLLGRSRD